MDMKSKLYVLHCSWVFTVRRYIQMAGELTRVLEATLDLRQTVPIESHVMLLIQLHYYIEHNMALKVQVHSKTQCS